MKRILMILFFAWLTSANAEYNFTTVEKRGIADDIVPCQWDNQEGVPCITISKGINNSNRIGDKISPTFTITSAEIKPALPTTQPNRRYIMAPRMVRIEGVKTPKIVPYF